MKGLKNRGKAREDGTLGLLPSETIFVDAAGHQQARTALTGTAFVRRLTSLVFDMDEVFAGTVAGKKKGLKRKAAGEIPEETSGDGEAIDPQKVEQIFGKLFLSGFLFFKLYDLL